MQRLALRGYDFDASSHLVLEIEAASHARKFLGSVLRERDWVTFGERDRLRKDGSESDREPAVSIGFTYRGLQALGVPDRYLNELRVKAPAFCEGAPASAVLRLGDAGPCAAEQWEPMFAFDRAHVLISIHGPNRGAVDAMAERLANTAGGRAGLKGWEDALPAKHLTTDKRNRTVHFGFRDNLARPRIVEERFEPDKLRHHAGELVLGYLNDSKFNRWDNILTAPDVAQFFRNGSFAVLRKVEQNEEAFNTYLNQQACALSVKTDYLKAKLCGRWPNGARVLPGHDLGGAVRVEAGRLFRLHGRQGGLRLPVRCTHPPHKPSRRFDRACSAAPIVSPRHALWPEILRRNEARETRNGGGETRTDWSFLLRQHRRSVRDSGVRVGREETDGTAEPRQLEGSVGWPP